MRATMPSVGHVGTLRLHEPCGPLVPEVGVASAHAHGVANPGAAGLERVRLAGAEDAVDLVLDPRVLHDSERSHVDLGRELSDHGHILFCALRLGESLVVDAHGRLLC